MILVDANLLVYAHVTSLSQHQAVRTWLDSRLNGPTPVGLPWATLLSFVRLVSNPRIFEHPESISAAWSQAEQWADLPGRLDSSTHGTPSEHPWFIIERYTVTLQPRARCSSGGVDY